MNPAMLIIIPTVLVVGWFCASFLYKTIGKFFFNIYKDAVDVINSEDDEKEQSKNA